LKGHSVIEQTLDDGSIRLTVPSNEPAMAWCQSNFVSVII